jgi:hypothetical protein
MFELFTKPAGKKETARGVILGFLAGIFVASGFYALNQLLEMFSPPIDAGLALFFFIITTYEVRKRLAGKAEVTETKSITQETEKLAPIPTPNQYDNAGNLLPEYWKCLVCQAKHKNNRATIAYRLTVFSMALENAQFFLELDQVEQTALKNYTDYLANPQGALLERPPGTEHLKNNTSGIAWGGSGMGFDAVYLCDMHKSEVDASLQSLANSGSGNEEKGVREQLTGNKQEKHPAQNVQPVEAESDLANSEKKDAPKTRPYQPGQKEPKEYIEYIAKLFEQKSKNNLDQIIVLVGFDDAHRVDEVLGQAGEINLHTADIKRSPQFGSRNPCIELHYQETIDQDLIETDARALKGWHATDISAVGISQETLQMLHYWYGEKSCPFLIAQSG